MHRNNELLMSHAGNGAALQAMDRAARAVAHPGGPSLFEDLVRELAAILGCDAVLVATFADDARERLHTLAAVLDGHPIPNFGYAIDGTVCALVLARGNYQFVAQDIPDDAALAGPLRGKRLASYAGYPLCDSEGTPLGIMSAMRRGALADPVLAEAMLKIFAARVSAEIERERNNEELRSAALAVSSKHGAAVLPELAHYMGTILHVDMAFIALVDEADPCELDMAALYVDGLTHKGWRYAAAGTPCEVVLARGFQSYPSGLAEVFPRDTDFASFGADSYAGFPLTDVDGRTIGLVAVVSRRPLVNIKRIESMLQIFAVRAAAEIGRFRAEAALRRSEASYRAIFESAEDAIFVHDWDTGAIIDVNAKACKDYGYSYEEMRNIDIAKISSGVPPYTAEEAMRRVGEAKLGNNPVFEWHRRNRDGSLHWDEVRLKAVELGGRRCIIAFTREITARKLAAQALLRSEARLRATVEAAFDSVVCMDAEGSILDFNAAAERCFGYRREQAIGRQLAELIIPQRYRGAHDEGLARFRETGKGPYVGRLIETSALRADGSEFPVELAVGAAPSPGGDIFVGYLRDITDRRHAEAQRSQLEAQLRQAQKMEAIGQLTGGIAHDFNNILTSIIGYTVLAAERAEALGDTRIQQQLGQVQRATQRARDLIAQMLTFSRRQRGERRPLALAGLLAQSLQLLRSMLPTTIELDSDLDTPVALVDVDPVQIEQVLFNLCINARDAITPPGRIGVVLRETAFESGHPACGSCKAALSGRWVEIAVSDTGGGIAPDVLDRMFDPFFTTKEVGRGSGMGLAMVHGILHEHGGHVLVEPAGEDGGHGTRFRVCLPVSSATEAATVAPANGAGTVPSELHGYVLLVEDEIMVGDFMAELLEGWGLQVTLLRHPREALQWFEQDRRAVDLVITDQTMPGLSGLELATRLTRSRPQLPVLLYTGYDEGIDDAILARHGVRALLRKPIEPTALRNALRSHLPTD